MKKKVLSAILSAALFFGTLSGALPVVNAVSYDVSDYEVAESEIPLRLYYDEEASHGVAEGYDNVDTSFGSGGSLIEKHPNDDWERWSIPIGNGYFGANLFGRTETERIQLTEKTLANPYKIVNESSLPTDGLNNFSETYIDFGHKNSAVSEYSRELDLKTAISTVSYKYNGVTYTREYFTSYPDKAMVIRLDASAEGELNFVLRPTVPYEQSYMTNAGDGGGKTGTVVSSVTNGVGKILLSGTLEYFDIDFAGVYNVYTTGGTVSATTTEHTWTDKDGTSHTDTDGTITVSGATSAYIVITMGTDYELTSEQFTQSRFNKPTFDTDVDDAIAKVEKYMTAASAYSYDQLKKRHLEDYQELFGRVTLNLDCDEADFALTTDELLANYKNGSGSTYLETLYFQYGRYLLIASSRSGALPANLQGAWNRYNHAPWSSGYWHNVNVQMNYWPAFSTNIAETFQAYVEYNNAYMAKAMSGATSMINKYNPGANGSDGGNGWSIATGGYVSDVSGSESIGNLGFTTQLFWEYFAYTQDETVLREKVYPVLVEAARFITKMVKEDADGNYIAVYSDSPEQYVGGEWYFTDKGTAYAQSFAYQNNYNLLLAAKELGISTDDASHEDYAILQTVLEQIDKYDPIRVGLSGQVKEFFEEDYYGDMGEYTHRHISQLVGLYPGNVINGTTPAWMDAAKYTLTERGDEATGWGVAHRLNLWARVQDGERAYDLLEQLLKVNTATNLWDLHPPFQIDGNLGGTAGISEMLLQSHAGYIEPLAAIPAAWANGSYTGLVARGNFEVSAAWANGLATSFNIKSLVGGSVTVKYSGIANAIVCDSDGNAVNFTITGRDLISFETEAGETYCIWGFSNIEKPDAVQGLAIQSEYLSASTLSWNESADAVKYNVYVAKNDASDYTLLGTTRGTSYTYTPMENENARLTFAVTAINSVGEESDRAIVYRNPDEVNSEVISVSANVVGEELQVAIKSNEHSRKFKLYYKNKASDAWSLLQESNYPIIIQPSYNADLIYGVSVVSSYGAECEVYELDYISSTLDEVKYDPSNILLHVGAMPTNDGLAYKHTSDIYGDYYKLIDGDYSASSGRFSTVQSANDVLEFDAVLLSDFALGELKIYDFQASSSSALYAGSHLKIDVFYDGEWKTAKEYNSNAEILALRKANTNYLSVDLSGFKARVIRIRIDTPVYDTTQRSISLNEIECTGVALKSDARGYGNVFEKYEFEPTNQTAASGVWLPYSAITDGIDDVWGTGQDNQDGRFATRGGYSADGTLDFNGKVYSLHTLRIRYTGTESNALCGKDIAIYVYRNEQWTEVAAQVYDTAVADITFDLGGVEAEKVRFCVSAQRDGANYIGIAEMSCYGFKLLDADLLTENILLGTTADKITIEGATLHQSASDPTAAFDGNLNSRYAVNDKQNTYSLTISLDSAYQLYTMSFYSFSDSSDSRSNQTKIEVYYNGAWTTVKEGFALPAVNAQRYDVYLDGALAEIVRITFTNTESTKSASLWELQCSGIKVKTASVFKDNVFDGHEFVGAEGTQIFAGYPYANLTDGVIGSWGSNRFGSGPSADGSYYADGTLDFDGKVYKLNQLDVYYTGTDYSGVDFNLYVYRNGQWTQVVARTYDTGVSSITVDLGGVEAEKVRFYVSKGRTVTVTNTNADTGETTTTTKIQYVGIQEITCIGYEIVDTTDDTGEYSNILLDTTADKLSVSGSNASVNSSYPLTNAFDGDQGTRYALYSSKPGSHSLTIALSDTYVLHTLKIYPFAEASDPNGRSSDTTVDLYVDGAWVQVTGSFVLAKGENTIDLGGIKADKIRINFNRDGAISSMTTIYEIECYGYLAATEALKEDTSSNILLGTPDDRLSVEGATIHTDTRFDKLSNAFDGKLDTRYAVGDVSKAPAGYSLTISLDAIHPLYTLSITPFYNGTDTYARSDDTTVELYRGGVLVKTIPSFALNKGQTDVDLGGISADTIKIRFNNTLSGAMATIYEIKCTTAIPIAGDRTQLLEAYKELEAATTLDAAHEELKNLKLDAMKELLMDTSADSDALSESITEVTSQANSIQYGYPVTTAYGDFSSVNLSLSDDVGVNFYASFKDTAFSNFEDAVVVIQLDNGSVYRTPLSELESDGDRYVLKMQLPATQMTDKINLRVIFDGNNCGNSHTTSIVEYANTILSDSSYEANYPGINELVKSMLNYGAYAQMYFGYKADKAENLANYGIYSEADNPVLNGDFSGAVAEKPVKTGTDERIDAAGWTLSLDANITIKFFFATHDIAKYDFRVTKPNGEVCIAEPVLHQDGNIYRVSINTEDVALIDDTYVLTITNVEDGKTITLEFSAMMYVNTILSGVTNPSDALSNIVKAIKLYCDSANTYRENGN